MHHRNLLFATALSGAAILVGQLAADHAAQSAARTGAITQATPAGAGTGAGGGGAGAGPQVQPIGAVGPDEIAAAIQAIVQWGPNAANTIVAYSLGHADCNIGDAPLAYQVTPSPSHPITAQNLFRLHDGRFEQLGQMWVQHSFCALQGSLCGSCGGGGGCQQVLHPGCSDPNTASRAGSQFGLGPKQHVNPSTGVFPTVPTFVTPAAIPGDNNNVHGRLQARKSDLYALNFPSARYFAEIQFIAPDDAAAGNGNNNASWREVAFAQPASPEQFATWTFPPSLLISGSGQQYPTTALGTNQQQIAMLAWPQFDTDPDNIVPVTIASVDVPGDGRFYLGYKVTDNHNGTYTYEYAIHNLNSDRSAQRFSVPHGEDAGFSQFGFHDVFYHWHFNPIAGAPPVPQYSDVDWSPVVSETDVEWATQSFTENENANALRWGTLYNYRFTANAPPVDVNATLGLFKPGLPGDPDSVTIPTVGPADGVPIPADLNGDGVVNGLDLGILLANWSIPPTAPGCAGATPCPADLNADGVVDGLDLGLLLAGWTL